MREKHARDPTTSNLNLQRRQPQLALLDDWQQTMAKRVQPGWGAKAGEQEQVDRGIGLQSTGAVAAADIFIWHVPVHILLLLYQIIIII